MLRQVRHCAALGNSGLRWWAAAATQRECLLLESTGGGPCLHTVATFDPGAWTTGSRCFFGAATPKLATPLTPSEAIRGARESSSAVDPTKTVEKQGPAKDWPVIRRPVLEAALKPYGSTTLADSILLLHGPRGVGKKTAIRAVQQEWSSPHHVIASIDLYRALQWSPSPRDSFPWLHRLYPEADSSGANSSGKEDKSSSNKERGGKKEFVPWEERTKRFTSVFSRRSRVLRTAVETALLAAVKAGISKGKIGAEDVFWALTWRRHVDAALECHLERGEVRAPDSSASFRRLESKAGPAYAKLTTLVESVEEDSDDSDEDFLAQAAKLDPVKQTSPETARLWLEALVNVPALVEKRVKGTSQADLALRALKLARSVLEIQEEWRCDGNGAHAADASVAWMLLCIDLLSACAEESTFEPKLIVSGIELLRRVPSIEHFSRGSRRAVKGVNFHDQLLLRVSERAKTMPIILTASDGYYASDFDEERKFLGDRLEPTEYFGWTGAEAAVHLVPRFFSTGQWARLVEVLGFNARHLADFHLLWAERASALTSAEREDLAEGSPFVLALKEYLGVLNEETFKPVMQDVIRRVAERGKERFAKTRSRGRSRGLLIKWDDVRWTRWATLEVLDFVRALQRARFGVNYVNLAASEFLEDEVARALLDVGILYQQRDPPFIRPVTKPFQDMLGAWFRDQWLQLSLQDKVVYAAQRLLRGRYYRHLVKESFGQKEVVLGEARYV